MVPITLRQPWRIATWRTVKGNPLDNFKLLYPTSGALEWTIKDGIPYHAPTLLADVQKIVAKARRQEGAGTP